jgi:isopenicillin-N epimerase
MSSEQVEFDLGRAATDPAVWMLDPKIVFHNHGSFGSCPRFVFEFQTRLRERLERQPIQFFVRDLEPLLDTARRELAAFVGAEPENLVFVPNATSGVNTVLRSLRFHPGDELLVTDHEYNACRNALDFVAQRSGASVVPVEIPFPLRNVNEVLDRVEARLSTRTRLALIDHVTSQTGLVLPMERLAQLLATRGIDLLVDGAHAPGMVPLNLSRSSATYYTGNCHKWICAPKGAAFLYVKPERQSAIRPLVISHGANSPRSDRSRFLIEFGWTGTWDATAYLSVPEALRYVGGLLPGGWPEIMRRNRALALAARQLLCRALETDIPCPPEMIGSLASIPLADATDVTPPTSPLYADPLQEELVRRFNIEVPVVPWPAPPKRVLRISAQLYNSLPQYELLADALRQILRPT